MDGENLKPEKVGSVSSTQKKHREFSKCILIVAGFLNIVVIAFTCVMVWRTCDLTPLAYLIPSTAAEVSVGTAFYYNKAKVENRIKLKAIYGVDLTPEDFGEEGSGSFPRYGGTYTDYTTQG